MKNILCFGDSNTYGESPEGFGRYEYHERWPGILQKKLGEEYHIIEEGLNGRTTVWDDPIELDKNGAKHLPMCITTHAPLDLVIIMLGTNDFKARFGVTASDIGQSAERLVQIAKVTPNYKDKPPFRILLVSPVHMQEKTFLGEVFGNRHEDSKRLGALYEDVAKRNGVDFLDISKYAAPSDIDGMHIDRENHKKVADAMEQKILEILG